MPTFPIDLTQWFSAGGHMPPWELYHIWRSKLYIYIYIERERERGVYIHPPSYQPLSVYSRTLDLFSQTWWEIGLTLTHWTMIFCKRVLNTVFLLLDWLPNQNWKTQSAILWSTWVGEDRFMPFWKAFA